MDKYSSIKFGEILSLENDDKILLPNFQRDFVWSTEQQKKLLASFIIDIPIGSILLVEGEGGEYSTRKLCIEEPYDQNTNKDCSYLLDGQQRISTLKNIFLNLHEDLIEWDKNLSNGKLYRSLKNRWFINLNPPENRELDLFGFEELVFDEKKLAEAKPDDIVPFLTSHNIYKGRDYQNKWYAPGYHDVELNITDKNKVSQINNLIADQAVSDYLVPLYTISDDSNKALHRIILDKLGHKRLDELKAIVNDDRLHLKKYFSDEAKIDEYIDNPLKFEKEINELWYKRLIKWTTDLDNYLNSLFNRQIARIKLSKDEINRAIFVFEELNRGGTNLSSFDLLVARYAISAPKEDKGLKFNIIEQIEKNVEIKSFVSSIFEKRIWNGKFLGLLDDKNPPITAFKNLFLNQLGLIAKAEGDFENYEQLNPSHIKEHYVLNLDSETINKYHKVATESIQRALLFLQINCGLYDLNKLGYKLTVLPISFLFTSDEVWSNPDAHKKIQYWYWSAIFSGTYREAQQPRTIRDLKKLTEWILYKGDNPFTESKDNIFEDQNYSDLDTLLMKSEDGVNKNLELTLLQFGLSNRPSDLIKSEYFKNDKSPRLNAFDIGDEKKEYNCIEKYDVKPVEHHIFPLGMFTRLDQNSSNLRYGHNVLNSPLNKTLISYTANSKLSDDDPNSYFSQLDELSYNDHFFIPSDIDSFFKQYSSNKSLEELIPLLDDVFIKRFEAIKAKVLSLLRDLEEHF